MSKYEFAKSWVNSTWMDDFRRGLLTYNPERFDHGRFNRLSRRARKKQQDDSWTDELRRSDTVQSIIESALTNGINITGLRAMVSERGLNGQIWVVDSKDDLIAAIAEILDLKADSWDNGHRFAWVGNGIFAVNFCHDQW